MFYYSSDGSLCYLNTRSFLNNWMSAADRYLVPRSTLCFHSLAVCSDGGMCHNGSQWTVCQPCNEAADPHVPDTHTASCDRNSQASRLAQADGIDLHFVPVNYMNLLKYVVDVPHFDCAVNGGSDHLHQTGYLWNSSVWRRAVTVRAFHSVRTHRVPVSNDKWFQCNDPAEMCIQHLHQVSGD